MRYANEANDAVLSEDGTAKVNRKNVGVWSNQFFEKEGKNLYFFAFAKGDAPFFKVYYRHEFRAEISSYLFKNGLLTIGKNGKYERTAELAARCAHLDIVTPPKAVAEMSDYEIEQRARKARGASYGHVKHRIHAGEPLKGKTLKLALELVGAGERGNSSDEFYSGIAKKLRAGEPLGEHEMHIMCDVILLHARLSPMGAGNGGSVP